MSRIAEAVSLSVMLGEAHADALPNIAEPHRAEEVVSFSGGAPEGRGAAGFGAQHHPSPKNTDPFFLESRQKEKKRESVYNGTQNSVMRCPKRLEWTPSMVEERLEQAMRVFKALPLTDRDRPSARMVAPLPIVRTLFQDEAPKRARMAQPAPPAPAEVDRAYEALTWVGFLASVRDRRLVLARAGGVPWAALEPKLGLSERQLRRRYQLSLRAIALNLIFRAICA